MRKKLGLIACIMLFALQLFAQPQHTGYWKATTPVRESSSCFLVQSETQMIAALRHFGWDLAIPPINWNEDSAVIVAPLIYFHGTQIVFYGISWRDGRFVLDWGRENIGKERGGETIVVAFKRHMHTANQFVCYERPYDQGAQAGGSKVISTGVETGTTSSSGSLPPAPPAPPQSSSPREHEGPPVGK